MKNINSSYMKEMNVAEMRTVNGGESKESKHKRWSDACTRHGGGGSIVEGIGHLLIEIFG